MDKTKNCLTNLSKTVSPNMRFVEICELESTSSKHISMIRPEGNCLSLCVNRNEKVLHVKIVLSDLTCKTISSALSRAHFCNAKFAHVGEDLAPKL